jgi:peptide-methionine (R)-S-oxide reductase
MVKYIIQKTDEEWKKQLTADQYKICRRKGTELPFLGKYVNSNDKGVYKCICCSIVHC